MRGSDGMATVPADGRPRHHWARTVRHNAAMILRHPTTSHHASGGGPNAQHAQPARPRTRHLPAVACMVAGAAMVLASCGSSSSARVVGAGSPAPAGLPAFYAVPSSLPSAPGQLVKYEKVAAAGVHGTAYRVMYTSRDQQGRTVVVTGLVYVPDRPAPPGGYRIVDWAHGTNGMTNQCAPSLTPGSAVPSLNALLDQGWEVTASDYQGEGTPPGLLAYLVGDMAGWNTIDIVRAVQHMAPAHASTTYVVWGHSEGGQTAMFAWQLGPRTAPGLHLAGVVAGAPPSQFAFIYQALLHSPFDFYLFMAAAGFHQAYGAAAPLSAVLTPTATSLLPVLRDGCYGEIQHALAHYQLTDLIKQDPFTVPQWKSLITASDPGAFTTGSHVPLLIIQGAQDEQIPVISTQLLASHLCAIGQEVQRWIYPGQSHAGVIGPSTPDMVHWIADRFAGGSFPDPVQPTGLPGVLDQDCQTPGGFTTP